MSEASRGVREAGETFCARQARVVASARTSVVNAMTYKAQPLLFAAVSLLAGCAPPPSALPPASAPAAALPWVTAAPLMSLWIAARSASRDPKPSENASTNLFFPEPVGFGAHADILARVYDDWGGHSPFANKLSYLPGDPTTLVSTDYAGNDGERPDLIDRSRFANVSVPIFSFQRKFGALEVGQVGGSVAVLRGGKLVDLVRPIGKPRAFIERGGELHAIGYAPQWNEDTETGWGDWSVVAIRADGSIRDDEVVARPSVPLNVDTVTSEFHNADYSTFGFKAEAYAGAGPLNPDLLT